MAVLAVVSVGVWAGGSFVQDVRAGSLNGASAVTTVSPGAQLPAAIGELPHRGVQPVWRPITGRPVTVTRAGDLALVDTTKRQSPSTLVVFLTNGAELRRAYTTFSLRVDLWESSAPGTKPAWHRMSAAARELTVVAGEVRFTVAPGRYYDVAVGRGGTLVASGMSNALSPSFYTTLSS